MYVRLAFAVAAHLDPEILLVDEVLAVGDAEFQRKCLGKMRDASMHGRTVVFISHNLGAIRTLCSHAYWVDGGRIVMDGPSESVVHAYLQDTEPGRDGEGEVVVADTAPRMGTGHARFRHVALLDAADRPVSGLHLGQPIRVSLSLEVERYFEQAVVEVGISTVEGQRIVTVQNTDFDGSPCALKAGRHSLVVEIAPGMLPGDFALDVAIHDVSGHTADFLERVLRFTTLNTSADGDDYYRWSVVRGYARPSARWELRAEQPVPAGAEPRVGGPDL
jgi:hypothetical protein